jgi:predicted flavoprotein YhiN
VSLKTETDGRVFPATNSSQTIINCLLNEANKYSVEILMKTEVKAFSIATINLKLFAIHPEIFLLIIYALPQVDMPNHQCLIG